ncbi:MAG: extracellular solute-binding protein [Clostridiaceae bacterium]
MKRSKLKSVSLLLVLALLFSMVLTACSDDNQSNNTQSTSTASPAANATPSPTAAAEPKAEERVTLTWFGTDSGCGIPAGIDVNDNEFINIVKDYANVNLKMEIVPLADFQTKCNLLLASGNYPDLLHTAYNENIQKVEDEGAFLDLKSYYDKSDAVKKWIPEANFEYTKTSEGKYYYIPMSQAKTPQGRGVIARLDLIEKYNSGVMPTTVEEWADYARKVKKELPTSVPISSWSPGSMIFAYNMEFWAWFGVDPNYTHTRIVNGVVTPDVYLPEYKEALIFNKKLYDDGLISPTFATNKDYAQYSADITNNNTIMWTDGADQISGYATYYPQKGFKLVFAPELSKYPSVVADKKYVHAAMNAYASNGLDTGHRVHISAKTKYPDQAWRVIEGFCQDELYEAIFWGKEGSEYVMKDGKRFLVPIKYNDPSRTWSLQLAMIMGFSAGIDAKDAQMAIILSNQELCDKVVASRTPLHDIAQSIGTNVAFWSYASDKEMAKYEEAGAFVTSLTSKFIMGKIDMAGFDKGIEEFRSKYQFIFDDRTKALTEHKNEFLEKGGISANW